MEKFLKENYLTKTKKELAKELGVSVNVVEWQLRKLNLTKYSNKKYSEEEITFIKNNYPSKGSLYCAKALNRSANAINKKIKKLGLEILYNYTYVSKEGYLVDCKDRNNKVLVHRKVMEEFLGRKLKSSEIVHHKDHNKLNNSVENLEILTRSSHASLHGKHKI